MPAQILQGEIEAARIDTTAKKAGKLRRVFMPEKTACKYDT